MWYEAIVELGHAYWKNGVSIGMLGTLIYLALKLRKIKQLLRRFLPFLFDEDSEIREYVQNQRIIMENQRLIMAAMGVDPVCLPVMGNAIISAHTKKPSALMFAAWRTSQLGAFFLVHYVVDQGRSSFTKLNIHWRKRQMKKWLKPDSLTVIGGVLAVAVSRYFGFEIDPANILAAVVLLIGFIKAHELVTVVRDANGLPSGFRLNSRKTIFTLVAFAGVVADTAFKFNLPMELILTVAAAVTGYNYLEATKDAKLAEAEGAEARQTY